MQINKSLAKLPLGGAVWCPLEALEGYSKHESPKAGYY